MTPFHAQKNQAFLFSYRLLNPETAGFPDGHKDLGHAEFHTLRCYSQLSE